MPNPNQQSDPAGQVSHPPATQGRRATHHRCQVCGNSFAGHDVLPASLVRDKILGLITERFPAWDPVGFICRDCLNGFRAEYVRSEMEKNPADLSVLEEAVMRSLRAG